MNRPLATRKRNAPGASPQVPQQVYSNNAPYTPAQPEVTSFDTSFNDWTNAGGVNDLSQFGGNPGFDASLYDGSMNGATGFGGIEVPDSQLIRRGQNQQLVPSDSTNTWQDPGGGGALNNPFEQVEEEEDLDQKAMAAMKDAQAKRKQIPPFVQKLSSFLDDNTNTDLIRWSDAGDSFVVLDEDEFARKLIPELFKHNNYASFVRQLNMYGFHKRVGLSDNSMKASENKKKTPSEYYNKYFRRGRPELLWLIQKPKNPPTTKRKRDEKGQGDSDEEPRPTAIPELAASQPKIIQGQGSDMTVIPKSELSSLRNEVASLQKQQKMITQVITQMRQQNEMFYRQATAYQDMHQRHENSINAILTFLATFYNRSLEGQNNINDLFNQSLPQGNVQPGNIVDIGDAEELQMPRRRQRQQLLLPAPPENTADVNPIDLTPNMNNTQPYSGQRSRNASDFRTPVSNATTPVTNTSTPQPKVEAESPSMVTDNDDMMSVINAANSATPKTAGPGLDFDTALHHFQNADGNTPLTQDQRNTMLSLMQQSLNHGQGSENINSVLTQPQTPPMPSLNQISAHNNQLDYLQRLTKEQRENVENLRTRIHSLSPSGYFPGLDHESSQPPDFNLDDWMLPPADDLGQFNFDDLDAQAAGLDNGEADGQNSTGAGADTGLLAPEKDGQYQYGTVESISSRATSPSSPANALKGDVGTSSPRKRRRAN